MCPRLQESQRAVITLVDGGRVLLFVKSFATGLYTPSEERGQIVVFKRS